MYLDEKHRRYQRAARLRREASNCLRIALSERDRETAAQLIDEALKLKTRALELAQEQTP